MSVLVVDGLYSFSWYGSLGAGHNATGKYGLAEADFYQLHAYGHAYLHGVGEMALVYPMTDAFAAPLEFTFPHSPGLRLWALPFCLESARLHLPDALLPQLLRAG